MPNVDADLDSDTGRELTTAVRLLSLTLDRVKRLEGRQPMGPVPTFDLDTEVERFIDSHITRLG